MGRSRGGLTTKIHALVDADGRPIRLELTPRSGGRCAHRRDPPRQARTGRDADRRPRLLHQCHPEPCHRARRLANIPPRSIRNGSFAFSTWVYRQRNLVERFFNRIKQFRGLATRYDRKPENYLAALKLAAVRIWIATI